MEQRKRRFAKITSDNIENTTEENKKNISTLFDAFKQLDEVCKPYNIECSSKNTTNYLSEQFYQEHFIMSAILEAFSVSDQISFTQLNQTIANYIPQEFIWNIPVSQINLAITKMKRLGFIDIVETENKYAPNFRITEDGAKIYQAYTFQTLASSSFFNYQTYQLNKKADKMSRYMLTATIISIVVAILSVMITIYVTYK